MENNKKNIFYSICLWLMAFTFCYAAFSTILKQFLLLAKNYLPRDIIALLSVGAVILITTLTCILLCSKKMNPRIRDTVLTGSKFAFALAILLLLLSIFLISLTGTGFISMYNSMLGKSFFLLMFVVTVSVGFLICALFIWLITRIKNTYIKIMTITLLCITPRLAVIFLTDVVPFSDFKLYFDIASKLLSQGRAHDLYVLTFPHILGYPSVLSLVFALTGASVLSAQLFNVFLSVLSAILVYATLKKITGNLGASAGVVLFCLNPNLIFFCAIISTETIFTFFMLAAIYVFISAVEKKDLEPWRLALYGLFCALSSFIRPIGILLIVSASIYLLLLVLKRENLLRRMICVLIMVVTYFAGTAANTEYVKFITKGEPAKSMSGYTLYVGMNSESFGTWNQADSKKLAEIQAKELSPDDVNKAMLHLTAERITDNFSMLPFLMLSKFEYLWGEDSFGVAWINASTPKESSKKIPMGPASNISNTVYFLLCTLAYIYVIYLIKQKGFYYSIYFVIIVLGFIGLHLVAEIQPRYHYPAIPLIIFFAAPAIEKIYFVLKKPTSRSAP